MTAFRETPEPWSADDHLERVQRRGRQLRRRRVVLVVVFAAALLIVVAAVAATA